MRGVVRSRLDAIPIHDNPGKLVLVQRALGEDEAD